MADEPHNVEMIFRDPYDDSRVYECTTCWELWDLVPPRRDDDDVCPNEVKEANGSPTEASPSGSDIPTGERESAVGWRGYREDGNGSRLLLD